MFKWLSRLITPVDCITCEYQSEDRMQGPNGPPQFFCLCPKKQEIKYSHAEGREITTSYPCWMMNEKGYCGQYKQKEE